MAISDAFAQVLAAGRAQFNQRVVEARRRFPAYDTHAFADFLQNGVDPVVRAVAQTAPERIATVTLAAYDIALELVGLALAGPAARSTLVNRVWQQLAPAYARLAAWQPMEVLGSLSNAAVNLGKVANARTEQWICNMAALAPRVETLPQFQAVGQILAWRAGIAHFRIGAIHATSQLPDELALAAMGVGDDVQWSALREQLLADPWWLPAQADPEKRHAVIEIGAFTGFGGQFAEPPQVRACPEGFFVRSASRYHFLVADAFGAVLHAATVEEFDHAKHYRFARAAAVQGTRLVIGTRQIDLDLPAHAIAVECNAHTVAVTSPFTHAIRLLPLQ